MWFILDEDLAKIIFLCYQKSLHCSPEAGLYWLFIGYIRCYIFVILAKFEDQFQSYYLSLYIYLNFSKPTGPESSQFYGSNCITGMIINFETNIVLKRTLFHLY